MIADCEAGRVYVSNTDFPVRIFIFLPDANNKSSAFKIKQYITGFFTMANFYLLTHV